MRIFVIAVSFLFSTSAVLGQEDTEVVTWIEDNSFPIESVVPNGSFDDLAPFRDIIGDARIVGIGESTHGTAEFNTFRHRMLEFLVEEMGFTALALETSYPDAYDLNQYILTGEGDPEELIHKMWFWVHNNEEVLAMVKWMRSYNETHDRKVQFYGIDVQFGWESIRYILDFFKEHDQEAADYFSNTFGYWAYKIKNRDDIFEWYGSYSTSDWYHKYQGQIMWLSQYIEYNRYDFVAAVGWNEYEELVRHMQNARFFFLQGNTLDTLDKSATNDGVMLREIGMSSTIESIMEKEGPDAKVMVWAHNGHVNYGLHDTPYIEGPSPYMGELVKQRYGDDYVSIALLFNMGSFVVNDFRPEAEELGTRAHLSVLSVPDAVEDTVEFTLAKVDQPVFAFSLHDIPEGSAAHDFFSAERPYKAIGSGFVALPDVSIDSSEDAHYFFAPLIGTHDAVVFFQESNAMRVLPRALENRNYVEEAFADIEK